MRKRRVTSENRRCHILSTCKIQCFLYDQNLPKQPPTSWKNVKTDNAEVSRVAWTAKKSTCYDRKPASQMLRVGNIFQPVCPENRCVATFKVNDNIQVGGREAGSLRVHLGRRKKTTRVARPPRICVPL